MQKPEIFKILNFPLTDAGNAERLQTVMAGDWRYIPEIRRWLHWNGQHWKETEQAAVLVAAVEAFRQMADAVCKLPRPQDEYERKRSDAVITFIERSENTAKLRAALAFLEGLLAADYSQFDANAWQINCLNGTLALKTSRLKAHDKTDYLIHITGAAYKERCPEASLWASTVEEILPVPSIRRWMQKWCGYCLSGSTQEERFVVAFGPGGRGKGTFFETVAAALGDYKASILIDVLLANGILKTGDAPTPEIAKLPGKRYVLSSESGKGRRLDEAKIKLLTGGDVLTARRIGAQPFEFRPSFKLILQTNFLPSIADSLDEGIRRRMVIIPFNAPIARRNSRLKSELLKPENLADCLTWCVTGCKMWLAEGLDDLPAEAAEAAEKFYHENDLLGQWLETETEYCQGGFLPFDKALQSFNRWLAAGGSGSFYQRRGFAEGMERHRKPKIRRNSGFGFADLALVNWKNE